MQPINFPLFGNSLVMAIVILVHVFFAFVAVGGLLISVVTEWIGHKKQSANHDRFARAYVEFLSDMMKLGGVLGVTIVVLLIGLFPEFTKRLYNIFFWSLIVEAALFFVMMAATIYYRATWGDVASKARHIAAGAVAAASAVVSSLIINAAHAFMLTPGKYFETGKLADAIFNPTTLASSTHLLLPCIINAAAFAFIYSMWKVGRAEGDDLSYYTWLRNYTAKIFATLILFQPLSGLSFILTVKTANETAYASIVGGNVAKFFWTMVGLAAIAVLSSFVFWISGRRAHKVLLAGSLAALVAFSFGGYTRERARKPYLIYGHMYMSDAVAATAQPVKTPLSPKAALSQRGCLACHTFQGEGGTFGPNLDVHLKHHSEKELKRLLKNPPAAMPPFSGTDEELDAFVDAIMK